MPSAAEEERGRIPATEGMLVALPLSFLDLKKGLATYSIAAKMTMSVVLATRYEVHACTGVRVVGSSEKKDVYTAAALASARRDSA